MNQARPADLKRQRTLRATTAAVACMPLLMACCTAQASAQKIDCELTYGGEVQHIQALPTRKPHAVPAEEIGSFFLFRIVWTTEPADLAAIKLYTYANLDAGPMLLHQQYWPAPLGELKGDFSGINRVYEPLRDSELIYRCRLLDHRENLPR